MSQYFQFLWMTSQRWWLKYKFIMTMTATIWLSRSSCAFLVITSVMYIHTSAVIICRNLPSEPKTGIGIGIVKITNQPDVTLHFNLYNLFLWNIFLLLFVRKYCFLFSGIELNTNEQGAKMSCLETARERIRCYVKNSILDSQNVFTCHTKFTYKAINRIHVLSLTARKLFNVKF